MRQSTPHPDWKLLDAGQFKESKVFETDIVIAGSGAGGALSAEIFAKAGLKVILIEEGPLFWTENFKLLESTAYPELYQECANRKTRTQDITILQGRAVGGSTTVNWTSSFRTPEQTLKHWTSHHGSTLAPEDLNPWFLSMEAKFQMAPWEIPPNQNNTVLANGAQKLGWHYGVISRNVKNCWNLGYCGMGCPTGAKQSMLVTCIPAALNHKATLIYRCRVKKIIWQGKKIQSLIGEAIGGSGNPTGSLVTLKTNHAILACGSIGTPAILLRSAIPDPYRLLGKRTFLHPVVASLAKFEAKIEAFSGAPQSVYSDHFLWAGGIEGSLGYKFEVPPLHPVLISTLFPAHGKTHASLMQQFPYLQAVIALGRDGFHPESIGGSVDLYSDEQPVLDYPITPYLWNGFKQAFCHMAELQFASGARWVMPVHWEAKLYRSWREAKQSINNLPMESFKTVVASAHVMGGCKMGVDPRDSVVNMSGQYHGFDNLWIMDGSIFPTSLGVNPQLSIYAMIARNATTLAESLRL